MNILKYLLFFLCSTGALAQSGIIKGKVVNATNNEPVSFATVALEGTAISTYTDIDGNYSLNNITPGTYNLVCFLLGYNKKIVYELMVTNSRVITMDIALEEVNTKLDSVVVTAQSFNKTEESPVSLRTINAAEIQRNPGGNRDISKVLQSLPGVASGVSFRNDIIIRGGAPNENRFFLDGIEVPNINHFATQGSSGGPVGMINVNFIREVDFYSGAFPSNRGNTLSSVLEFKQSDGNDQRLITNFTMGSSDLGLTFDGPMGKKSTFLFSARRSYLQFLFQALQLPFLPTYNDFQYKQVIRLNEKNKITLIGLGAIDDFELNKNANDNVSDSAVLTRNNYILGYLPVSKQWNYTAGAKWQHYLENGSLLFVVSRNHLNNTSEKYKDNIETEANKIIKYQSQEIENKFRFEHTFRTKGWKLNYGTAYENATYTNSTYQKTSIGAIPLLLDFSSRLTFNKYGMFGQLSKSLKENKLILSLGLRTDFNDYSTSMSNPLKQLSPRFSLAWALAPKWTLNFNTGRYYQLPAYTVLGYRDANNNLVNKNNKVSYIGCDHVVTGLEYNPTNFSKITLEGFYKNYFNYPFLLNDSISLANLGADFGVIGNEPAVSTSKGRSYGFEVLMQQKLSTSVYGILAYTFVKSEFTDKAGKYIPSAWDNGHILSLTAGKKFKKNWELGAKFRLLGGAPYTPFDLNATALKQVWDIRKQAVPDYQQLNSKRLPLSHGLDIRVDKRWYFKRWSLNLYFDIQNAYNFKAQLPDFINVKTDANNQPIADPNNPNAYLLSRIPNENGTVLPSIGVMLEF